MERFWNVHLDPRKRTVWIEGSTHFFLPSPTKNPPTRNAGSRPGKFKIVVSEISCFSGDEKGIYFNCDLLCEVKLRGSGCTYASRANAVRRSWIERPPLCWTFVSIPKKGGLQWIRTDAPSDSSHYNTFE